MNRQEVTQKRILIMTAVTAEQEAVQRGLNDFPGIDVLLAGVGPVAAAVRTTRALTAKPYDLVVSAGIGGGFPGIAMVGSLVVATEIIAADLGAETAEGFCTLEDLGFGVTRIPVAIDLARRFTVQLRQAGLTVQVGPILTLSTVTGSAAGAAELTARVPGAAAEAMEGYGVAFAAQEYGIPVLEFRAISNWVGPRDRDAWKIKEALAVLETAASLLKEVF